MLDMNPQLREIMQNPELLRQLTSPETMQVHQFKQLICVFSVCAGQTSLMTLCGFYIGNMMLING